MVTSAALKDGRPPDLTMLSADLGLFLISA
jgi:hypothetical protein